jgi:hypothetical protein
MKKFSLLSIFLSLVISLSAQQSANKSAPLKNWIVDLSRTRSSFEGIKIDKIELNNDYTVVHMSFDNHSFSDQHIEACNTFHIVSNGKKVAQFVKAENIPTRKIKGIPFECADFSTAMKIKAGQFVRFRLFFTRMPENVNAVDVIEYDGTKDCEFDVFNINLSKKEPLTNPTVAAATSKTIKTPTKKVVKPPKKGESDKTPPLIASKSVPTPETKVAENTEPKVTVPKIMAPENRAVKVVKEVPLSSKTVLIDVWDNDMEDGDKVSIMLNDRWILRDFAVTKNKKKIEITLKPGINKLVFHADNMGKMPPNTATLSFYDGTDLQTITLKSDMENSQGVHLIKN